METIKITKGQPFALWVPTIMLNADGEQAVDAGTLTNVVVEVTNGCEAKSVVSHAFEHWLVLNFGNDLNVGPCSIRIRGVLESGRAFSLALSKPVEIVNWDKESNWDRFIIGDHIELTDHPFITGRFVTNEEYEELKAKLRQSIAAAEQAEAEAEAAKSEWEQKAAELDNMARQQTLVEGIAAAAKDATVAKQATLAAKAAMILEAIAQIDFSALAKQGSNNNISLTTMDEKLGNVVMTTEEEYAAFKSHMETEIANILTPITEE